MVASTDPRITHIERLVRSIDLPIGRWDSDARLVFCNDHYIEWAGRPREQLLGRSLADLFGDTAWAAAAPAFAQAFTGLTVRYQRQLGHGPASGRWVRIQVFPDTDASGAVQAVFTIATDVHDDIVARETLLESQRRLDRFTDNIPYPLTYVDRDFVLRFVNKAYTELVEQPREALIGQQIGKARGARLWAEHEPYFLRALSGEAVQYTRLASTLPKGSRWLRTSYAPDFDAAGRVVGVYTVTVDVHELAVTQEKLKRRVEHDALTDVLSRRTMMDRVEAAVAEAAHQTVALYFVDLDGFKAVNDRFGHGEGDLLLVAVGAALQAAVRAEDAVGRFGGDEFLVMAKVRDADGAHSLALHMLATVQASAGARPMPGVVSVSIGYALAPGDARQPLNLLQLADDAMYAAKRLGKNRAMHCAAIPFEATR